jgi:lysophospholipase L1-like esterase
MTPRGKVLIIGDSISLGYTPHVAALLAGEFEVAHHEGNSGDSGNVLDRLDVWLDADADAQLIHFNVGLHDMRHWHDERGVQVPIERYRDNLTEIVGRLGTTGKTLVWATTTPVIDSRIEATVPGFVRRNEDVVAYNAAAAEIVEAAGLPVDDLFGVLTEAGPEEMISPDGTHMTDAGYRLLAEAVAQTIRQHCSGPTAQGAKT